MIFKKRKNKLTFFRQYDYDDSYGVSTEISKRELKNIKIHFKTEKLEVGNNHNKGDNIYLQCKFNKLWYPFHDLDSEDKLDLFKEIYRDIPYVIFKSSSDHYWGIIDKEYRKIKELYKDINWNLYNDKKYVDLTRDTNNKVHLPIRGLFDKMSRRPKLIEKNLNFTENFTIFINELEKYYNEDALELSCLLYRNEDMLKIFNRKNKLKSIE